MHFSNCATVVAAVALPLAAAQSLANLPTCAQPAIQQGITSTTCALTDYTCICGSTSFIGGIQSKIESDCSASDQKATIAFAKSVCSAAGVALKIGDEEPKKDAPASKAPDAAPASAAPPAASSAAPMESPAAASSAVTAPSVTPPYPVSTNGSVGGANCTNTTGAPFLGAAAGRSSAVLSSVAAAVVGLVGVWFL